MFLAVACQGWRLHHPSLYVQGSTVSSSSLGFQKVHVARTTLEFFLSQGVKFTLPCPSQGGKWDVSKEGKLLSYT